MRKVSLLFSMLLLLAQFLPAQTYTVLHSFTSGADGGYIYAGPTLDAGGNLYGTTGAGGADNDGVVYKYKTSAGTLSALYSFTGATDGRGLATRVIIGPNGSLYGSDAEGGTNNHGVVYNLQPPQSICISFSCPWSETTLYTFATSSGYDTGRNDLMFDSVGNIYGAAVNGGAYGYGTIFEMTYSGGAWTKTDIFSFGASSGDGQNPSGGVVFDASGNIYVPTTAGGEYSCGVVDKLTLVSGVWTETVLYSFNCSSYNGAGGTLVLDASGNIYGGTEFSGIGGGGCVYELTHSGVFNVLANFGGGAGGPVQGVAMDASGTLYGTTQNDGLYEEGNIFKLTPSGGGWAYTSLHDFTGGTDGGLPQGKVAISSTGVLYGTAFNGGAGYGVLWEYQQ